MTEKRFKEIISTQKVIDTVTNKEYDCLLDNDFYDLVNEIAEENEELKKDVEYWKQVANQYSNELNVFKHCKKYKTECKDIYWSGD